MNSKIVEIACTLTSILENIPHEKNLRFLYDKHPFHKFFLDQQEHCPELLRNITFHNTLGGTYSQDLGEVIDYLRIGGALWGESHNYEIKVYSPGKERHQTALQMLVTYPALADLAQKFERRFCIDSLNYLQDEPLEQ